MGAACSKDDSAVPNGDTPNSHDPLAEATPKRGGLFGGCLHDPSAVDPRHMDSCRADALDPVMYDLCRKSLKMTLLAEEENRQQQQQQQQNSMMQESAPPISSSSSQSPGPKKKTASSSSSSAQSQHHIGQYHLLFKHQSKTGSLPSETNTTDGATHNNNKSSPTSTNNNSNVASDDFVDTVPTTSPYSTRLIVRRRPITHAAEEGTHGTHLYAIRYPPDHAVETKKVTSASNSDSNRMHQEQCPTKASKKRTTNTTNPDPAAEPFPEPPKATPQQQQQQPPLPTEGLVDFFQPAKMKEATSNLSKQTSEFRHVCVCVSCSDFRVIMICHALVDLMVVVFSSALSRFSYLPGSIYV